MVNWVIPPGRIDEARAVMNFAHDLGIWFTPVPENVGPTVDAGLHRDPVYPAPVETIPKRKKGGARLTGSPRTNRRLLKSERLECRNTPKPRTDFDRKRAWPGKATVNVKLEWIAVRIKFDDVDALSDCATSKVHRARFRGPACNHRGANCNWAQNDTTDAYGRSLRHLGSPLGGTREFPGSR